MRIIGGTLKGRRLAAVRGRGTRPTADRVREALFSRIESRYGFGGGLVLDLFAGTGALGIEALSRGCERLVCVERAPRALEVLRANLVRVGLSERVRVLGEDWAKALARLNGERPRFCGAFVDPPYRLGLANEVIATRALAVVLVPGAWVSIETAREETLSDAEGWLVKVREDCYGDTKLSLYETIRDGLEGNQ